MKKAYILVRSGPLRGKRYPINALTMMLGRAENCDLVLGDYEQVSRSHALLNFFEGKLTITDRGSTNGVKVNGQSIQNRTLNSGDQIELGDFSATIVFEGETPKKSDLFNTIQHKWSSLPGTNPQKGGVALCILIVLFLGGIGMRGQGTSDPFETTPKIPDQTSASTIPDATGATVQTGIVAAIEPVNGRISPEAVKNVKAATVLIAHPVSGGYEMGSGFALGDSKRIVTNRHVVVDKNGNPQDCLLIFEAGTPRERKISVAADRISLLPAAGGKQEFQNDLAAIALDNPQTPALPAGKSENLTETDDVYAVGFPLGTQVLTLNDDLPSVSVKTAVVERLNRDKNNEVNVIQLGSSVTHGNSGGPVVNNRGEVVGVISSGVDGTTMSYAIPMVFVRALP